MDIVTAQACCSAELVASPEPHGRKGHCPLSNGVLLHKGGKERWINKSGSPLISRTFQGILRPRVTTNIKAVIVKRPWPQCLDEAGREGDHRHQMTTV